MLIVVSKVSNEAPNLSLHKTGTTTLSENWTCKRPNRVLHCLDPSTCRCTITDMSTLSKNWTNHVNELKARRNP